MTLSIKDGNKLIAQFMGGYKYPDTEQTIDIWATEHGGLHVLNMQYHADWHWLMPVVEKIESCDGDIHIEGGNIFLHFPFQANKKMERFDYEKAKETKINSVWQAVIAFIQWYNTQ